MKKALLLAFIFVALASQAQIKRFTLHAGASYPLIADQEQPALMTLPISTGTGYTSVTIENGIAERFEEKAGFTIGGALDYAIGARFFLHTGLQASYLRFKRTISISKIEGLETFPLPVGPSVPGRPFGEIVGGGSWPVTISAATDRLGETTTLYLQVPLMVGTSFANNRLLVRAGTTLSLLTRATTYRSEFLYTGEHLTVSEYKDNSTEGYTQFLAAATAQASYLVTNRIGIDFTASKFFTPIYKKEQRSGGEAKYAVLSLGISYHISR